MTRPLQRRRSSRGWTACLAALAASSVLVVTGPAASAQTPDDQPPTLPPMQIVLLVDESGSLSADGVAREKEAARTIALGAPSPDTTVSVVGFGSSDGSSGQTAAITRCPPTKVDSGPARDGLARCIGDVRARTPQEGNHTDHVAALRQGLGFLDGPEGSAKIVFLLTDGRLDVEDSPAYGRNLGPQERTEAARDQIPGLLADITRVGGQVWPLGFGADIDQAALAGFATGDPCTPTERRPEARVVADAPNVLNQAVIDAYKSAGCVGADELQTGLLPQAGETELTVEIPAIASDSAILVYKRDARVQVTYLDPTGKVAEGAGADGSRFEFSGQGTETESLHIVDPVPGTWTVRLRSTSDVPPQDVAATVLFQGAVNAVLVLTPPQPAAGQQVSAAMQVRARRAGITDPELLRGLTFTATLTGSSIGPEQRATLTDDDRDGTFTAPFTVPADATGDLTFTGTVSGIGIGGDERVVTTTVRPQAADLDGQLRLTDATATVLPGDTLPGEASITNRSAQERRLRLQVVDPGPGTVVTVDPPIITVPASGTAVVPFSVRFGDDTVLGGNQVVLQAVDDADPSTVVAAQPIARQVTEKPLLPAWLLWSLLALLVVLVLAGLFAWRSAAAARRRRQVRGLRVELQRGGRTVNELTPLSPSASVFRFSIHDNGVTGAQLEHADSSDGTTYELRRDRGGIVLLPVGEGENPQIAAGGRRTVHGDTVLVVHDDRGAEPHGTAHGSPGGDGGYVDPYADLGAGYGYADDSTVSHQRPSYAEPPSYAQPPSYAEPPRRSDPSQYGPPTRGGGDPDHGAWQDPNNPWGRQ